MKEKWAFLKNAGLFLVTLYIFALAETSFAISFSWSNWIPAPLTWVPFLVYLALFRKPFEGILSIYVTMLALSLLTIAPIGQLLLAGLVLFIFTQLVKARVFSPDIKYFMILSFIASFIVQITLWVGNFIYNKYNAGFPPIFFWIGQAFTTLLPSYLLFYVLRFLDQFTDKPVLTEASLES